MTARPRSMFPLTDYIIGLLTVDRAKLATLNPEKMAEKYGIAVADARGYLEQYRQIRGA